MPCPKCGQPAYSPTNNDITHTKAYCLCRECWWNGQVDRINAVFASLEATPSSDGYQDWSSKDIASRDPGMLRGEKRHVVKKFEPMGG
jgi:transcription elongation factor Elf1